MVGSRSGGDGKLSERAVKEAIASLNWTALEGHITDITLSRGELTEICGHFRRCTELICKYPRRELERRRAVFLRQLESFAVTRFGSDAAEEVAREGFLIQQIERGYRGLLDVLARCAIAKQPATVRVSGSISRACYEYHDLLRRRDLVMASDKEFEVTADLRLPDDNGRMFSADGVVEGLSESVAMTIIMESYRNDWFADEIVVLPDLPSVGEDERYQSGATQVLALFWRQWQRVEKRRRFLGGELKIRTGNERPRRLPETVKSVIEYLPPEKGLSDREVYDYLANTRLKDRLVQTYMEMEIEVGLSGKGVGIDAGAALPPTQLVSGYEAHAGVSLSEVVGYSIVDDDELPGGLRLLEWIRGYAVLKEIAQSRTDKASSGDEYAVVLEAAELLSILRSCGLAGSSADQFVALTSLHRSSRDMFDCPLVRIGPANYLLFAPALIDLNIAVTVLSNLSNRGAVLARKGKAFEQSIHEMLGKQGLKVFAFTARRDGEEFEYDAVVPWDDYIFLFECKNRSLSGNDPAQAYYFELEVASQAKQVRRLADGLTRYPDIMEKELGAEQLGKTVVPCVLHSLPYSRFGDLDGVYFTDRSALARFLEQPYLRIKVPHRIGNATLLHRTAIKKFWKGDQPTASELMSFLEEPFQLELSLKHLDIKPFDFGLSESEVGLTHELSRTEITARSMCEAVGVDADGVFKEIAEITKHAEALRARLEDHSNSEEGLDV